MTLKTKRRKLAKNTIRFYQYHRNRKKSGYSKGIAPEIYQV